MPGFVTPLLVAGAGPMAAAYADVLAAMDVPFEAVGRGATSAAAFEAATGVPARAGGLAARLAEGAAPETAIVAVGARDLEAATRALLEAGVRRLLVEKPAALTEDGITGLAAAAEAVGAETFVAYNRRFLASTLAAEAAIAEDGGPLSAKFDFTEASRRIEALGKDPAELRAWFLGNSTHVVDLAFHLGGLPRRLSGAVRGSLSWHEGAVFAGHGETQTGALLSWHADWLAPGRWGVEVMTARRRLILQPLETLRIQEHGSFAEAEAPLDDELDRRFKPGLHRQTEAFLTGDATRLLPLAEHARRAPLYRVIRGGGEIGDFPQ